MNAQAKAMKRPGPIDMNPPVIGLLARMNFSIGSLARPSSGRGGRYPETLCCAFRSKFAGPRANSRRFYRIFAARLRGKVRGEGSGRGLRDDGRGTKDGWDCG